MVGDLLSTSYSRQGRQRLIGICVCQIGEASSAHYCRRTFIALAIGVLLVFECLSSAQSVAAGLKDDPLSGRTVTIDAILKRHVESVSNIQWYGSEQLIGQFTDPETDESVVRIISLDGAPERHLGEGALPAVSPDGRLLIHYIDDGWIVRDLSSGKRLRIDEATDGQWDYRPAFRPVWSSDGRYAAVVEHYRAAGADNVSELASRRGSVPVIDVEDQVSVLAQRGSRITIFDRENPTEQHRILLREFALEVGWGFDSALYVSKSKMHSGDASTTIARFQPNSREVREIYRTSGRFQSMRPAVHPSRGIIAAVLDADNRTWEDFQSLLLIDAGSGKELCRLTKDLPLLGRDYVWSRQGNEIYARVRQGGLDQIYSIPLKGGARQLTHGVRRHYEIALSLEGDRLAYQTEDGYGRKDIRVLDLETGQEEIVLVLDDPTTEFILGDWQQIRWNSTDGVRPFGFLFLPPNFDPARQYPMLVDVHGGGEGSRLYLSAPLTISVAPGPLEWHAWAALGYVVFVPDYRSTGGYGPEVIRARYQSGMSASVYDIEDILSGTRFVMAQGFVDPSKVGVLGHSAGGKRVLMLLTRHDLYAAADRKSVV